MEEKYLGLDFTDIDREDIPYDGELEEYDMIENGYGDCLMFTNRKTFILVTNDPITFLSNDRRFTPWHKK